VWDLGKAACLEYAEAGWDNGFLPVGIRDLDRLELRFEAPAYGTRYQDGSESRTKSHRDNGTHLMQTLAGRLVWCLGLVQDGLAPFCITGLHRHLASGLHEPEQGKGR
jgi:hypothetical protein